MPTTNPPTQRQSEILEFIKRYIVKNGLPPTIREIGTAMGINSPNGVMSHMKPLVSKGLLRHEPLINRGWVPVYPDGCCASCGQALPEIDS